MKNMDQTPVERVRELLADADHERQRAYAAEDLMRAMRLGGRGRTKITSVTFGVRYNDEYREMTGIQQTLFYDFLQKQYDEALARAVECEAKAVS